MLIWWLWETQKFLIVKSLYPSMEEKWWENDQKDLKTLHQLTCLTPPERIVKGCQYQLKCEWKKEISRYFQLRLIAWMEDSSRDGADEQFVSHKIRSLSSHHPPSSGPRAIILSHYIYLCKTQNRKHKENLENYIEFSFLQPSSHVPVPITVIPLKVSKEFRRTYIWRPTNAFALLKVLSPLRFYYLSHDLSLDDLSIKIFADKYVDVGNFSEDCAEYFALCYGETPLVTIRHSDLTMQRNAMWS